MGQRYFLYLTAVLLLVIGLGGWWLYDQTLNPVTMTRQPSPSDGQEKDKSQKEEKIRLTTLYDNYLFKPELKTGWGFSCLIETAERNILFDTGADSATLLSNMRKLKIDPGELDLVVLSHIHSDHVDGLPGLLTENNQLKVFGLAAFPESFRSQTEAQGAEYQSISKFQRLIPDIYTTGQLGSHIKEQALVIDSPRGLVVITGCAHPGVAVMVREAKEQLKKKIYLVLGGFHLSGTVDSKILGIIKELRDLKVEQVAPCHCSGDRARQLFEQEYGKDYLENGVGRVIIIE